MACLIRRLTEPNMTTGVDYSRKTSILFFLVGIMSITLSKQSITALSTSPFPSSPLLSLVRNSSIKLVLLDRDGVINVDVGTPGVVDPSQLRLTDRAATAIGTLQRQGHCRVVLITNQSCVGKGLITLDELDRIHNQLQEKLLAEDSDARWDTVYACCTTKSVPDPRRKPRPGMILEACAEWGVDPADCVMIGDTLNDLRAAAAAGVSRRILVSTGECACVHLCR